MSGRLTAALRVAVAAKAAAPPRLLPLWLAMLAALLLLLPGCGHRPSLQGTDDEIRQLQEQVPEVDTRPPPAVVQKRDTYVDARPRRLLSGWPASRQQLLRLAPGTARQQLQWLAALAGQGLRTQIDGPQAASFAARLAQEPRLGYRLGPSLVAEMLQGLGEHWGLHLDWRSGSLVASNRVHRTYALAALAGRSSHRLSESESGGEGSGLSGVQSLQRDLDLQALIGAQVAALGGAGAEVSVAGDLASVVVRAPAVAMPAIDAYMRRLNEDLRRQVEVDVRLLEVQLEDEFGGGINWTALHTDLRTTAALQLTSPAAEPLQNSLQVISTDPQRPDDLVEALIGVFRRQGDVRVLTSPRGVTLNHQLMRIALQTQTSYLARTTSTSVNDSTGVSTTAGLEPDTVEAGFSLLLLPRVERGHVVMHMAVDIASLDSIDSVASGGQSIQVPVVTRSRFSHRVRVADGHTLVLGGVRQLRADRSSQGVIGRHGSLQRRVERVLLVTPRIRLTPL